eukprot:CAMPEP_0172400860 /NCGR_PEP_ID=MMETSP1061-20121228/47779_1 /TAXON_ID=37318 /ORGANISM="Pseudo-nitzschia pungens, Strain cf. pungens" /LENGTH=588 /DNA_ID=CAMNT_0013134287 /DNA_START=109 /DNA_END=1875 /DNA_ORIENTATION=+
MYCGDETGSFIGEIGSHTCRFGYGGEDNPKLTTPSYVVSGNGDKSGDAYPRRRMSRLSSLHAPRENELMESILRMPGSGSDNDYSLPITNPNLFLRQGEVVENWDNLQTAWETSMDVLRATDTLKHTKGGTPYERTKKQKREHRASGLSSSTVTGSKDGDDTIGGGRCVHPILAVTPGFSEYTLGDNEGDEVTGPQFQSATKRQQYTTYTELLMESLDATSAFLAPAPMLAAFSMGRQTALVVDIGAGGCRVTPVVDGLILKQSQRRNGRGGDWLGDVTWRALLEEKRRECEEGDNEEKNTNKGGKNESSSPATMIRPRYMMRGKDKNKYDGKLLNSVFHRRAMNDLMYEIRTEPFVTLYGTDQMEKIRIPFTSKGSNKRDDDNDDDVTMISPPGTPGSTAPNKAEPGSPESIMTNDESSLYELPDGTPIELSSSSFGKDLCQLPELLFCEESTLPFQNRPCNNNSSGSSTSGQATFSNAPLHRLIQESLLAVGDVDARKELASCICLVGATSLLPNIETRLSQELSALLPSFVKPRVIAPKVSSVERSCAAWIGASILTSLGSFQQLWLSRAEYEEYGATMSIQRFP